MAEQLAELNKGDLYDTGTQDIKYNGTTVGWYRRIGHTVTVYVRYIGNFITINMTTTLPADCRPPIDLCYALLCGGAGDQLGYFWIRKATGIIELTKAGGTDAGVLTCTYLV